MRVAITVKGRFHAFDLARELDRRGHLSRLVTSYPRFAAARFGVDPSKVIGLSSIELASRVIERIPFRGFRTGLGLAWNRRFEKRAAAFVDRSADVLVGWSGVSLASLRAASALGVTTVLERGSCHIEEQRRLLEEESQIIGAPVALPADEVVARELEEYATADFIAVPGRFARDTFVARGVPREKLLVAPYGVELSRFSPPDRPSDRLRVLYCGAVSAQKGVHYLLEAFASLPDDRLELWLVGPVLDEMRATLARYRSPRVRVFGRRKGSELPDLYRQCSMFCLPSIQDGMGVVLLQAMACGLPVIASDHTGGPDLIEHGREGWLVPIRDPQSIAARIAALCAADDLRLAMGRAARARAMSEFGWHDYADRALENYRAARHRGIAASQPDRTGTDGHAERATVARRGAATP